MNLGMMEVTGGGASRSRLCAKDKAQVQGLLESQEAPGALPSDCGALPGWAASPGLRPRLQGDLPCPQPAPECGLLGLLWRHPEGHKPGLCLSHREASGLPPTQAHTHCTTRLFQNTKILWATSLAGPLLRARGGLSWWNT